MISGNDACHFADLQNVSIFNDNPALIILKDFP